MRRATHVGARWLVAISLVVTSVVGYASSSLLDEDSFAGLVSGSVRSPQVRSLLATKAVDVAIDASDADVLLADALPDNLSAVATPALELSKPAISEAGAQILRLGAIETGLDAAARSIHRQTSRAITSEDEADVVVNALPVLVVVADEIAGDVGARAVVGLELPDSATSINLGSNQNPVWSVVRTLGYIAAAGLLLWVVAILVYFATAPAGGRMAAARRLGRTIAKSGIVIMVIAFLALLAAAAIIEVVLTPAEGFSFGKLSLGAGAAGGGAALAEAVFSPLLATGRRSIMYGLVIVGATYLFGGGAVARSLRETLRSRDAHGLLETLREQLPHHVRHTRQALAGGLAVVLILWPQITFRVVLTLSLLTGAALLLLTAVVGELPVWRNLRSFTGLEHVTATDETSRSADGARYRRWLVGGALMLAIIWPSYSLSGVVLLVVLVSAAAMLTYRWELRSPEVVHAPVLDLAADDGSAWFTKRKLAIGAVIALGAVLLAASGDSANPAAATTFTASSPGSCNGHVELCDRTLDQVVLAGTHNSMSASELGWELANHELAIPAQLDAGIRALLIDVQYWPQGESLEDLQLDPEAARIAASALAVAKAPEDGLWMCHNLCQLGGTPFFDFLADLRVFLETHPDDVLVVVIQDDAPAPDIKAAIDAASITEFTFAHEPGTPWPTLGEMIERNQRVVFFAENEADDTGWYQRAFDGNVADTGFRYSVLEDFDCATNRGAGGDFFMINHWVETGLPVPSEADDVNSRETLNERVDECVEVQDRLPSIIAVNFWERGDLFEVVDALNGFLENE